MIEPEQWCAELDALLGRRSAATDRAKALLPTLHDLFGSHQMWFGLGDAAWLLNHHKVPTARGKLWSRPQVMRLLAIGDDQDIDPVYFERIQSWLEYYDIGIIPSRDRLDATKPVVDKVRDRFAAIKIAYREQAKAAKDVQFDIRRAMVYDKP